MAEWLFWISLAFVFYVYLGYPALLLVWGWLAASEVERASYEPEVTLIIAAYNEKDNIRQKLLNCLALDYPRDRLQIIVSLDGSTDGTDILAIKASTRGIHVMYSPRHAGKAAAINNAARSARGAVLVFVDARQTLHHNVIRELTANFSDRSVGAVSGELVLTSGTMESRSGVGLYWKYEKFIRMRESRIHSVAGATGAIYAIRRECFRALPEDAILDDVMLPMSIVLSGRRVIMDPAAQAFDRAAEDPRLEFGRKVRTLAGNFQLLSYMPELLIPWRNPIFVQFMSHKVARLLCPYALAVLFISNLFLLQGTYLVFLALQVAWYGLAIAGYAAWNDRLIAIAAASEKQKAPSHT
jgi:cellulose synthase/poly-beta-1,6-N-acetylglucosamine synthase-like glycosyltransferase